MGKYKTIRAKVTEMSVLREQKQKIQFERRSSLDFPPHTHDDVELAYVVRGGGQATCHGEPYTLSAGDFFLVAPNRVHHYVGFDGGDYIVLVMKPARLQSYGQCLLRTAPRQAVISSAESETAHLFAEALEEYERHGDSDAVGGYLTALLGRLLRDCAMEEGDGQSHWLAAVLDYCNRHYREPLTVDAVATALYISRSQLSHGFRRQVGMTFLQHLNALRLIDAAARLAETDAPVTEIALEVGFASLRSFDRAFSGRYGMTPREYRKR